jgi:hypothetical protein
MKTSSCVNFGGFDATKPPDEEQPPAVRTKLTTDSTRPDEDGDDNPA